MKKSHFILWNLFIISFSFAQQQTTIFKLGVENIPSSLLQTVCPDKQKELCAVGFITNQTGVDQHGKRTVDILISQGIAVKYIFAPEHGLSGTPAGKDVHDAVDKKTKIPVLSLYGNGSGKMISPEHMNEFDGLMGARMMLWLGGCNQQKTADLLQLPLDTLRWLDEEIRKYIPFPPRGLSGRHPDYLKPYRKMKAGVAQDIVRRKQNGYKQGQSLSYQPLDPFSEKLVPNNEEKNV